MAEANRLPHHNNDVMAQLSWYWYIVETDNFRPRKTYGKKTSLKSLLALSLSSGPITCSFVIFTNLVCLAHSPGLRSCEQKNHTIWWVMPLRQKFLFSLGKFASCFYRFLTVPIERTDAVQLQLSHMYRWMYKYFHLSIPGISRGAPSTLTAMNVIHF